MIGVKAKGLDGFIKKLRQKDLIMKGKVTEIKRKLVSDVFTDLVKGSPQWSGNLASNWYIDFHGAKSAYNPIPNYHPTYYQDSDKYQVGMNPAVSDTLNREIPKISQIRWNTNVTIINQTPYAKEVEEGKGPDYKKIRPENHKYGQVAMVGYVMTKYSKLKTLKRRL